MIILKTQLHHVPCRVSRISLVAGVLILFLSPTLSFSQDRKPINNKQQIRQTRAKSIKRKEQATTRDIAGRKLRTKNQSSAQRAVYSAQSPYRGKRNRGDQVGQPIGGSAPRVRSRSGEMARANVYPQKGPFVNNSSRKPEQSYSNRRELSRLARLQTRQDPPGKKKRIVPRSGSQAYVTRGRKNVYWGKYSKGERAITTDIAGGQLRTRNFRTPPNEIIKASGPYAGRRPGGDRAYRGSFQSGYKTASRRGELPWKGDISGQPLRKSKGRDNQVAGEPGTAPRIAPGFSARYMAKDLSRLRGIKEKKGGGSVTGKYKSNQPLSPRAPGASANYMQKDLGKLKGIKPTKGGGSVSARLKRGNNTSLGARAPGNPRVATMQGNYRGNLRREELSFSQQGLSYSGNIRAARPPKGGGSISARMQKNNNNMPIPVREPTDQRIANFQGNYKGFIRRDRASQGFSQEGLSYTGNIRQRPRAFSQEGYNFSGYQKTKKPLKGGGSVSGRLWNNDNKPIPGRTPGGAAGNIDKYQGNIPLVRKSYSQEGYDFSGYQKTKKPLKGGGSVSGRLWNNDNKPIPGRTPGEGASNIDKYQGNIPMVRKSYSQEGYDFSGYQKTKKPLKGGGSVSGKLWNNDNKPIPSRTPGEATRNIDKYQGNIPLVKKSFSQEGYDFTGYQKTKKPEKGGGSVSGRLWNNGGEPLPARTGDKAGEINYSGKIRLPLLKREFVRNPNSVEEALKKHAPYENVYRVNNLTVSVKQKDTDTKPKAVKGSLPGVPPSKETVKASEYSSSLKMYWSYKQNPSSAKDAQKTIAYSKAFREATDFAGKTRLTKNYRHNPHSDREALKVIAPSRAYARLDDYQGNIKMNKFNHKKHFPDAQFAHNQDNNVKSERTILTNAKLVWSNLFKKNSTQPDAVKDKVRRPRYDKKEKELWKDLYD